MADIAPQPRAPEISVPDLPSHHDTSLSTKTVVYKGTKVQDETILDFYTRLNHLRTIAGVSLLTAPSLANKVVTVKEGIEDVYSAITNTKNNIENLSSSVIKAPKIPVKGQDLLVSTDTIATLETDIGTLENHCIVFSPACTTNKSSNRTTYTAANSSNKAGFNNANRTGYHNAFFVVGNSGFRSAFFSSVFIFNKPYNYFPFHSPRCGSGKSSFWSSNKKSGKGTWHASNFSGFFATNWGGNATAITHGNSTNWGTNTAVNAANWSGNDTNNFASNFVSNASTCTVVHTTFSAK